MTFCDFKTIMMLDVIVGWTASDIEPESILKYTGTLQPQELLVKASLSPAWPSSDYARN
jgi:hypothetical protein